MSAMDIYFKNTRDWPEEIQPYIESICALDGDVSSLTEEDMQLANSNYCVNPPKNIEQQKIREILDCPVAKVNPL